MKKLFTLFVGLLAFSFSMDAQNKQNTPFRKVPNGLEQLKRYTLLDGPQQATTTIAPYKVTPPAMTSSATVTKIPFGSSYNAYGLLVSSSNCLAANEDINVVEMIHRVCAGTSGGAGVSGYIQTTGTTDLGVTVDSASTRIIIQSDIHHCRYPSGAIYNPSGNTDPNMAFTFVSGPFHPGADWDGYYLGSMRLDGQYNDQQYITTYADSGVHFVREASCATDNGKVYACGMNVNPNATDASDYRYKGGVLVTGTFDTITNTFSWADTLFAPNFSYGSDGYPNVWGGTPLTAWSLDGQTGYVVFLGILDTTAMTHYNPIVYKTTDGGATWAMKDVFDFSTLSIIADNMIPTTGGNIRPLFSKNNAWDATVDANGELHIVMEIASGYSDDPDSSGYSWSVDPDTQDPLPSLIYDIFTTSDSWDAVLLGTILTASISDTDAPNITGLSVGWDGRVQISRTKDGNKLFYSWMDTDPGFSDYNILPDLFVMGYDITTGYVTPLVNLTQGTDYDANNFFLYLSDFTFEDNGTYTLHMTTSILAYNDDTDETYHYYVSGATFEEADFTSAIHENSKAIFSIANSYPNPFESSTRFDLTLTEKAMVSIEVSNALGQKVVSESYQMNTGMNSVVIDGATLEAGIYFCTVKANGSTETLKLVKE